MPVVNFTNIKVGQVYVTRGGTVVIDKSGKTVGWGYDRIRVIKKSSSKLLIETPWGTSCVVKSTYPLSATREVALQTGFKLITTYLSKQEIPFDDAVAQGICVESIPRNDLEIEKFLVDLIDYFSTPQSIPSAVQKFGKTYQKIRYSIGKIENIPGYEVIRKDTPEVKIIHIVKVK